MRSALQRHGWLLFWAVIAIVVIAFIVQAWIPRLHWTLSGLLG